MASYDMNKINASLLKQYKDSFNDESNYYNTVSYDTFFSSYLNNCSDPFIQNMSVILKRDYEQIKNGYNSISNWWSSYNSNIEALENNLASKMGSYINDSVISNFINNSLPVLDNYNIDYNEIYDDGFTTDNIIFINNELTVNIEGIYDFLKDTVPNKAEELISKYKNAADNYGYIDKNLFITDINSILDELIDTQHTRMITKFLRKLDNNISNNVDYKSLMIKLTLNADALGMAALNAYLIENDIHLQDKYNEEAMKLITNGEIDKAITIITNLKTYIKEDFFDYENALNALIVNKKTDVVVQLLKKLKDKAIDYNVDNLIERIVKTGDINTIISIFKGALENDLAINTNYYYLLTVTKQNSDLSTYEQLRDVVIEILNKKVKEASNLDVYNLFTETLKKYGNEDALFILNNLYLLNEKYSFKLENNDCVDSYSYVSPNEKVAIISINNESLAAKKYSTILHELGHNLFSVLGNEEIPEAYFLIEEKTISRLATLTENGYLGSDNLIATFLSFNKIYDAISDRVSEEIDREKIIQECRDLYGDINEEEMKEVLKLYLPEGMIDAYMEFPRERLIEEIADYEFSSIKDLKLPVALENDPEAKGISSISDIICSIFKGYPFYDDSINQKYRQSIPMPGIHTRSYYKLDDTLSFHEQFADFTCLKMSNNTEKLELLKNLMGDDWYNVMDETYNLYLNKLKERKNEY